MVDEAPEVLITAPLLRFNLGVVMVMLVSEVRVTSAPTVVVPLVVEVFAVVIDTCPPLKLSVAAPPVLAKTTGWSATGAFVVTMPLPEEGIKLIELPSVDMVAEEPPGRFIVSGLGPFTLLSTEIPLPDDTGEPTAEWAPRFSDWVFNSNRLLLVTVTPAARFIAPG